MNEPIALPSKIAQCRTCGSEFLPKEWQIRASDYQCKTCKCEIQRKVAAADPLYKEKKRAWNARPHVKEYQRQYLKFHTDPIKRKARRKVATEVGAGRLMRLPCCVCGNPRTEAHHEDYLKPLDVTWLCKPHHVLADAMLAARKEGSK